MWEPEARALGWPKKPLGWEDILREARNPTALGRFGHPKWGSFRLGHTNPDFSTSGLSAIAAEYYAATGKTEGLTLADVNRPACASSSATSSPRSSTTATPRCSSSSSSRLTGRPSRPPWRWRRTPSSTSTCAAKARPAEAGGGVSEGGDVLLGQPAVRPEGAVDDAATSGSRPQKVVDYLLKPRCSSSCRRPATARPTRPPTPAPGSRPPTAPTRRSRPATCRCPTRR